MLHPFEIFYWLVQYNYWPKCAVVMSCACEFKHVRRYSTITHLDIIDHLRHPTLPPLPTVASQYLRVVSRMWRLKMLLSVQYVLDLCTMLFSAEKMKPNSVTRLDPQKNIAKRFSSINDLELEFVIVIDHA